MRALVLAPMTPEALEALGKLMPTAYEPWTETRRLYDPEELAARLDSEEVSVLVVEADFLFEEMFQRARPLRFAAVCRGALNQVDLEAATAHGVVVVHTPGRNAQGVAELTLGLMFALARRIPQAHCYVTGGQWQDPTEAYITLRGIELEGRTLGVIGLGAIGRRVARLGRALGMHVLAFDPYVTAPRRGGVAMVSLERLLASSDFITIHVPSTPQTEGLLGAERLSLVKHGAYLVSMSSPEVLDRDALLRALADGPLVGAAFDVHESHPIPPSSPLLRLENVVLTPHIGGATDGTVRRQSQMVLEDLARFLEGRRPRRLANPAVWRHRGR